MKNIRGKEIKQEYQEKRTKGERKAFEAVQRQTKDFV